MHNLDKEYGVLIVNDFRAHSTQCDFAEEVEKKE